MIDSIKITSLNNIGSNLSYSTIFPVVDVSGTPITDKANLQIIGNYILSQAGGANMVQAAQATLAQSVVNAAQPNITSVGTLTSLVVSGNANITGNLNIPVSDLKIFGGTNGYVLQTDGTGNLTWTAQTGGGGGNGSPGGSNTQVQFNDSGAFGGNSGFTYDKTTSTLSVGNVALPGNAVLGAANGNILFNTPNNSTLTIRASDGVMLHNWIFESDGTLTFPTNRLFINGDVSIFGTNSAVIQSNNQTPLNLITSGANSALAMLWIEDYANINSSNVAGVYANPAPGARGVRLVTGNVGNFNNWNFENDGNLVLPSNSFAVKYANGTQVSLSGTYGNSNVATFLASYGSNTISTTGNVTAGNIIGNGQALTSINGANVTGTVPHANVAEYANVQIANANITGYSIALVDWIAGNHRIEAELNNLKFNANTHTLSTVNIVANTSANIGNLRLSENVIAAVGLNLRGDVTESYAYLSLPSDANSATQPAHLGNDNGNVQISTINQAGPSSYIWTFDNGGNLTLPGNTFAVNYANGAQVSLGGGNVSQLTNGDESFVLDSDGNVVFEGLNPGQGINRGMVWDYGANVGGNNSEVRQDNDGLTVRAWTENGGGANGYSAPVRLVTNQSTNEKQWIFDGQGNLTMPGNLIMAAGNIQSATISPAFNSAITGITTGNPTVIVTLIDLVFSNPYSGTVTISGVTGTTEANGTWGYQAVEANEFQLFTDATLTTPVDGTTWTAYVSGGDAVGVSEYTSLNIQGGNVSISSNDSDWVFGTNGNLILAGGNSVIQSIANSSLDPLNPNVSTMALTPDANYSSQALVLDPTAPGHIHLRSPGANIDEPYANLFLGGENTSFEVGAFYGATPNAYIHSGGNTWTFASDGNLIFPRDANINTDPYLQIAGGINPTIISIDSSLAGPANLAIVSDYLNLSGYNGAKVAVYADDGEIIGDNALALTTNGANVGNTYTWAFGVDGELTVPGNLVATAASPAPVISGFSSVSALQFTNGNSNVTINANSNLWTFDSTGNLIVPGTSGGVIKTVANGAISIAAIDNGSDNPAQVISFNANGTPTTALSAYASEATIQANINGDIKTWAFNNAGNLVLPGNTLAINYANGTAAFGNIVSVNKDGNASNVLLGNGVFSSLPSPTSIVNGNSNVAVAANGNVTVGVAGTANVITATSTGANVTGTLNATGNVTAQGTGSNIIRRAFGLVASDVGVTLDDLTVTVSSATSQLTLSTSGSWQGTGWTETFAGGGTPTVNNWVNLPLNPGFNNASGAMNSQGNGCRCVISDQTPTAKVYQITVVRSGTSGAQWNISIERLV